jgi:hypothetical protein
VPTVRVFAPVTLVLPLSETDITTEKSADGG